MHRESLPLLGWNLIFGAAALSATAATRFLAPGYNSGTAPTTQIDFVVSVAFAVYRIDMMVRNVGGAGQTMIGTVRKNGAATTSVLATASDAATGSVVLSNPLSFVAGDSFGFAVVKSGTFTSPDDIMYTLGLSTFG